MLDFLLMLVVLAAAAGLGYVVIRRIPSMLHTPLMSMTNAVSGVVLLGALLLFAVPAGRSEQILGGIALAAATFNVVGGFAITDRMLGLFHKGAAPGQESATECRRS
ncbi:MAG: proton-translocating transhydrogenase family protein [Phycisphaerae bacterium]|jgi:NAD(P) transhydrogenase subunit alpha|nr:proton-translocating transhydrogenase family protein [Phycisphaerae bacterium]